MDNIQNPEQPLDIRRPALDLYRQRAELQGISDYSDKTMALHDKKLSEINAEINRLELSVAGLSREVLSHSDLPSLRQFRDIWLQKSLRYAGSDYEAKVGESRKQIDQLLEFLRQLDEIRKRPAATPDDHATAREALAGLERANAAWLTPTQHEALAAAGRALDGRVAQEQQKAAAWLARVEADSQADGRDPLDFMKILDTPPPFLAADQQARLDALRHRTQERIDENALHRIEQIFLDIRDPDLRRRCVIRLSELVNP